MIKLTIGITCAAVGLLGVLGLPACSSAEDPPGTGGTTGSGGSSAGTPSSGGSSAGTPATGGTGGSTGGTGGSTGGSMSAGGTNPVGCQGISRDMPCPTEGQACPGLKCGLCDSGTRECNCTAGVWACTSCDFSASEFMTPPTAPATCDTQADEVPCAGMMGTVCTGSAGGDVCGCCNPATFSDGEVWDCDSPPSTWP